MKKIAIIFLSSSLLFITGCNNNSSNESNIEKEKTEVTKDIDKETKEDTSNKEVKKEIKTEEVKKDNSVKPKEKEDQKEEEKEEKPNKNEIEKAISKIYEVTENKDANYIYMSPEDTYVHNESKEFKNKYYVFSEVSGEAISDCNYLVDKKTFVVYRYIPEGTMEKLEKSKPNEIEKSISRIYAVVQHNDAKYQYMSPDDTYVHGESEEFKNKYYVFSEVYGEGDELTISDCNYLVDKNTFEVYRYSPGGELENLG